MTRQESGGSTVAKNKPGHPLGKDQAAVVSGHSFDNAAQSQNPPATDRGPAEGALGFGHSLQLWGPSGGNSAPSQFVKLESSLGSTVASALDGKDVSDTGNRAINEGVIEPFITLTSALQINYTAASQLLPLINDLQSRIGIIPNSTQFSGMERMNGWKATLSNMKPTDTLNHKQIDQLSSDADLAYVTMTNYLQKMR